MKRRILALLLCLCMAATLLPTAAWAADADEESGPVLVYLAIGEDTDHTVSPNAFYPEFWVYNEDLRTTRVFTYPFQAGRTGYLNLELPENDTDSRVEVSQDGQVLQASYHDEERNYYNYRPISLDQGETITIKVTKGEKSTTYTVNMGELDVFLDGFSLPDTFKMQPAFQRDKTLYAVRVPAGAESIPVTVEAGDGAEVHVNCSLYSGSVGCEQDAENPNRYIVPLSYSSDYGSFDVTSFLVTVYRGHVSQNYDFTIVRPTTVRLPRSLFWPNHEYSDYNARAYDGQPHTDMVTYRPVLDPAKLTFEYVCTSYGDQEKVTEITDAGWYKVYVSYEGDEVFPAIKNQQLSNTFNSDPMIVILRRAQAAVTGVPADKALTIGYDEHYGEVDLPGIKVTDGKGNELPGKWCLFLKGSTSGGFSSEIGGTYEVEAYYSFSPENNYYRNWELEERIPLTVTIEKRVLTDKDITVLWDKRTEYTYTGGAQYPEASIDSPLPYNSYTTARSFLDAEGNELEDRPFEAGTYTERLTLTLTDEAKEKYEFVGDNKDSYVADKTYTIKQREIDADLTITSYTSSDGEMRLNLRPTSLWDLSSDGYTFTFTKDGEPIVLQSSGSYTLGKDEEGTFTYAVTLNDTKNYKFSADSVTSVSVQVKDGAVIRAHNWASEWDMNNTHHWHNCTDSDCPITDNSQKDGYAAHVYDNDADAACNTCGYIRTVSSGGNTGGSSSSDGGSSSGGGSGTSTSTTTNPDGSTTTTSENRVTGTVTETTKSPDGSQTVVETQKDGTVTTTETDKDGNRTQTVEKTDGSSVTTVQQKDGTTASVNTDTSGKVEAEVSLPQAVAAAAQESGKALALPIPEVKATRSTDSAPAVTVKTNSSEAVKVEIPTANVTPGTVAVLVKADGTEEIIKSSVPTADGVAVSVADGATVKLVDNSRDFADVSDGHWASGAVDFASARELFAGTSETDFSPEQSMTRAMLMTVLARYDGTDTSGGATWYEKAMEWSVANGISDGSNPDSAITREQLAAMLYRYSGSPAAGNSLDGFSDANEISDYAQAAMRWAVENGIINGFGNGTLGPKAQATRAQVAQMLMNFIGM